VAFGDSDLNMMMADVFSVAITYGAQTATGFKDDGEQLVGIDNGAFSIRTRTVYIQTGDLTSLTVDSAITVDSVVYNITAIAPRDDGKITSLRLTT
jgi:predicted GNAT superfamily acetyltransferase